jgi:hypothetical protein
MIFLYVPCILTFNLEKVWKEDIVVDGRILLEGIVEGEGAKLLIGFTWLRIGTSGGFL